LLAFSRQQIVEPVVLDLNSVVEDVVKMLSGVIGEGISLQTFLDEDVERVQMDRGHAEQILVNLLLNARDAMPQGGQLTIETANVPGNTDVSESAVMLTVTDTGIGMDTETRSRIFEPFFTTKERGKGTGLGLASVYGFVKQNRGSICVQSELGRGSTFRILLPRATSNTAAVTMINQDRLLSGNETPKTVLLVEDEAPLREFIHTVLTAHGYNVLEAADGFEGLSVGRQYEGPIHLLLSDIVMPGPNGPQVSEELTNFRPDMRTLFISGYPEFAGDSRVPHQGMILLPKPFTQNDLLRKMREILEPSPRLAA
jgi:two-component system cell cycle sensor histidine kinase/response regulator CckA